MGDILGLGITHYPPLSYKGNLASRIKLLLADPIARLFTGLPATGIIQAALVAGATAAFYVWFMNDDFSLST